MTERTYPEPREPNLADLDPDDLTADRLIALVRSRRAGETYPAPDQLLTHLPTVLRALVDYLLSGEAAALEAAYRLASVIEAVEGAVAPPSSPDRRH
ncbi:MAG: hypothetical protein IPK64_22155 [bacterium]|nr:hypothetical protein [bacterium]